MVKKIINPENNFESVKIKHKKYLIITASDWKYGNFLKDNWLVSLIENSDLSQTDVVILDYGLTPEQKKNILEKKIVKIIKCRRDGHVVNIRYRDAMNFLKKEKYEQILMCDSGDLIFQGDITKAFQIEKNKIRGVLENTAAYFNNYVLLNKPFTKKIDKEISLIKEKRKSINGGLIIAPRKTFLNLCKYIYKNITKKYIFGPDQILLNLFFFKNDFHCLDKTYNFVITVQEKSGFKIKKGIFFDEKGKKIITVHNAGSKNYFRPIKNFGYGKNKNKLKIATYYSIRLFNKATNFLYDFAHKKIKMKFNYNF